MNRSQSSRMEEYKKDFFSVVKGSTPIKPYEGLSQCVDKYGKCSSVRTANGFVKCLWRPLDLPLESTSEIMNAGIKERRKAYFLCDMITIIKSLDKNIEN